MTATQLEPYACHCTQEEQEEQERKNKETIATAFLSLLSLFCRVVLANKLSKQTDFLLLSFASVTSLHLADLCADNKTK